VNGTGTINGGGGVDFRKEMKAREKTKMGEKGKKGRAISIRSGRTERGKGKSDEKERERKTCEKHEQVAKTVWIGKNTRKEKTPTERVGSKAKNLHP